MKAMLTITVILEAVTGVTLVVAPSSVALLLLGASLDAVAAQTVARIAGAALISLGVACWFARHDPTRRAARGMITAMLLYNAVVVAILVSGATGGELRGVGLWPTAILHTILAVWCIAELCSRQSGTARESQPTA